jgi:hypothetical protein
MLAFSLAHNFRAVIRFAKMKFASALTVVFALASSSTCKADQFLRGRTLTAEHDEMAFQKAKIITTKTLPNNSTITFYEPEEGIISVVHDSPPEAQEGDMMSSSKATKSSSQAGSIPETPGELFKILTGEDVVPKSLVVAETRMNKHNARRSLPPPPPPSESSDEDDEQGMNDDGETAVENDGGRNLVSCDKWEQNECIKDAHGVSDYCKCFSCRTGNARVQYTSKATYSKAKPFRGSVNHNIWYFDRYMEALGKQRCQGGPYQ